MKKVFDISPRLCYCLFMNITFSAANSKLKKLEVALQRKVISFALPSGYTCPFAQDCKSCANRETGKIQDGAETKFRCFSASAECSYPNLRKMVWANLESLTNCNDSLSMADLICANLPEFFNICRIHIGGDFFSQDYFDAWIEVALRNPQKTFYAYTKSLKFWVNRFDEIPNNLILTASRGGKLDYLIDKFNLKCSEVVFTEAEAAEKGFEIDHDDSHALGNKSFALLIHGTQPAKTKAAKAVSLIRQTNKPTIKITVKSL